MIQILEKVLFEIWHKVFEFCDVTFVQLIKAAFLITSKHQKTQIDIRLVWLILGNFPYELRKSSEECFKKVINNDEGEHWWL